MAGLHARSVRSHRREGQLPPGTAPRQLRRAQVRAAADQAPRHADTVSCAPAPDGVIEGSRADVSFIVGMLIDKFALPPAAVPPAPAPDRCGLQGQPALADAADAAGRRSCSSRSTRRSSTRSAPAASRRWTRPRSRPGRPAPGKMKLALLLAGLRRTRRGVLPVSPVAPASARGRIAGPAGARERRAAQRRLRCVRGIRGKNGIRHARCWSHLQTVLRQASRRRTASRPMRRCR